MTSGSLLPNFDRVTTIDPWPKKWWDWAGLTDYQTGWIYLHPAIYRDLARLHQGWKPKGVSRTLAAFAILTLAHELAHRHGEHNEAKAQREGKRTFVAVARRLGVGPIRARTLRLLIL